MQKITLLLSVQFFVHSFSYNVVTRLREANNKQKLPTTKNKQQTTPNKRKEVYRYEDEQPEP